MKLRYYLQIIKCFYLKSSAVLSHCRWSYFNLRTNMHTFYSVHGTSAYSDCTAKTAVSTACLVKVLCSHFARELRVV